MEFLLSLLSDVLDFVTEVLLLPVLQGSQFDFKEAYLTYHRSREVNWKDKTCVTWYPYVNVSGDVHDIPAVEVKGAKNG